MSVPNSPSKNHQCKECGKWYKTEHRLKTHQSKIHEKRQRLGGEHICCYCGEKLATESVLGKHMKHEHGKAKRKLNEGQCYINRYRKVKREIPEKYHDVYNELTGNGKSLLSVQAAICYIESSVTQKGASEAFAVSETIIRNTVEDIVDHGVVSLDYIQSNCKRTGDGMFGNRTAGKRKWTPKQ